jgi:hypothetical protein
MSKYFLFLILLISINANEEPKNKTSNTTKTLIDSKKSFNLTVDTIDTMIFCSIIMDEKVKKYASKIEKLQKKLNVTTPELVSNKISVDIFEKCNQNIKIERVNKYIKNLTFVEDFYWEKYYDVISDIDFDVYKNTSDLEYTTNQTLLMHHYQKAEEIFKQKQDEDRERYIKANQKIRIGNLDLENIPQNFKLGIFLIIFLIFFGGIFYFLKGLNKKIGSNPKRKKKKTQ